MHHDTTGLQFDQKVREANAKFVAVCQRTFADRATVDERSVTRA